MDLIEQIKTSAAKYTSVIEWKKASPGLLKRAQQMGIYHAVTAHMMRKLQIGKWTKEAVLKSTKGFKTYSEWRDAYSGARKAAEKMGLDLSAYFPERINHWSADVVLLEAKKYKSKNEWRKKSASSHQAAVRLGIVAECIQHMRRPPSNKIVWTEELTKQDALRFNSRGDWWAKSRSAYYAAKRLNIFEECVMHMTKPMTSSHESELLAYVQSKFPSAHRAMIGQRSKVPASHFELDIYIPELNKGIEFNGKYWHASGFYRSWTNDPTYYHRVKRQFLNNHGIDYIEIDECSWLMDKQLCLRQVDKFLEGKHG